MESKLFDLEHLQQLTYERSKTWASFLDNVAESEIPDEIDINELEDVYREDCDDDNNDELVSMEDDESDSLAVDSEILKNVTNSTRFALLFNKNQTVALPESAKNGKNDALVDIFNQTLPIINEHNRQLKETGFDRILSTFDKKKIEDKVGSWLNRHNSLYGGDNTILCADSNKICENEYKTMTATRQKKIGRSSRKRSPISSRINDDSDDSLHSGETARYIRSSRAGAMKNSASTTTMIKTYRMVKSTREALREKYACEKAEDDYHLKAIRHRRRYGNELEYHHSHYDLPRLQKSSKHELQARAPSACKERRKVLRKRTYSNSCNSMDTSSDSDYYEKEKHFRNRKHLTPCCSQYHRSKEHITRSAKSQRSALKMPSARMNRMYYFSQSISRNLSSSSSSTSFNSSVERRRLMRKNEKFYNDKRPCRWESECQCCNDRKLCEEYKHVANSSTDEWYVENSYTPKNALQTPVANTKSYIAMPRKLAAVTEVENEKDVIKTKTSSKTKALPKPPSEKEKPKSKSKTTNIKSSSKAADPLEDSFDIELEMALKASRELYEKEQEVKNQQSTSKKEKHEILSTKVIRKTLKLQENEQVAEKEPKKAHKRRTNKNKNIADKEVEVNEKLPKLYEKENNNDQQDNDGVFIKPNKVPIKNSLKTKDSLISTTEETFFAVSQAQGICNSTAVSTKSSAYNRQILDNLIDIDEDSQEDKEEFEAKNVTTENRKAKSSMASLSLTINKKVPTKKAATSTTVTSTTIRSPEVINITSSSNETETIRIYDEPNDCTLVTSTTNIELPPPPLPPVRAIEEIPKNTQQPQQGEALVSFPLTQKGIIIYAPEMRSTAPAYSFTSDGYFTITKEHLSRIIGEKPAEKFLKYYIGRKRFNSNSTVYFRPPRNASLDGVSSSSDSDDDLDNLGQYGDLYESLNKNT